MLILKGNKGKSVIVEQLLSNLNSRCFVYYEHSLPFENYHIDCNQHSLIELRELIKTIDIQNHFDLIVIYTNKTEDELSGFIGWLSLHEKDFNCKQMLLTCK